MTRFVLYRILGNDLPPRHSQEQTLSNLLFILEHEPIFAGCEKRWVVNRIADREQEQKIISLLEQHGQKYIHLPFEIDQYAKCRFDFDGLPKELFMHNGNLAASPVYLRGKALEYPFRYKNLYAINNNGARNAALEEGRSLAEWILPWDGCCFLTKAAWNAILRDMETLQDEKYLIVPMARVHNNLFLLEDIFSPTPVEEPQIAFHRDALERFDVRFRYGSGPKVELLRRLQVPGQFGSGVKVPWEPQDLKISSEAGKFLNAGWVARLFSGLPCTKDEPAQRHSHRMNGIVKKLSELDEKVLCQRFNKDDLVFYNEAALSENRKAWLDGEQTIAPAVEKLMDIAEPVLGSQIFSIPDKTTIPPSGDTHDYLSPSGVELQHPASIHAASDIDGTRRTRETQLYSPESMRYDHTPLQLVFDHTVALALAWYFTGESRFAERAALLIRTWFCHSDTRMNPNLRFARIRIGQEVEQQGQGIIEAKDICFFLDAVRLVIRAGQLTLSEQSQFRQWCQEYLGWLLNSKQGVRMFHAQNHHGTYYDLQVASLAAYLDDAQTMLRVLRVSTMRAAQQFQPDGSQLEELKRANSLHCSVLNLFGWFHLDKLAKLAGMNLWDARVRSCGCPADSLRWLLSFKEGGWPYPQQVMFDHEQLTLLHFLATKFKQLDEQKSGVATSLNTQQIKQVFHPSAGVPPFWMLGTKIH